MLGDNGTLLAYTSAMQQKKRSKKKTAAAVGVGVMAYRYKIVGNKAKYTAQANLLKRDAGFLHGAAKGMAHDYKGMHRGGQVAVGAAFVGAAGYAGYKHRQDIKKGAHWVNTQVHSRERHKQAAKLYGTTLVVRGGGNIRHGIRNRNARSFGYGMGQLTTGTAIHRQVRKSNKKGGTH